MALREVGHARGAAARGRESSSDRSVVLLSGEQPRQRLAHERTLRHSASASNAIERNGLSLGQSNGHSDHGPIMPRSDSPCKLPYGNSYG